MDNPTATDVRTDALRALHDAILTAKQHLTNEKSAAEMDLRQSLENALVKLQSLPSTHSTREPHGSGRAAPNGPPGAA